MRVLFPVLLESVCMLGQEYETIEKTWIPCSLNPNRSEPKSEAEPVWLPVDMYIVATVD